MENLKQLVELTDQETLERARELKNAYQREWHNRPENQHKRSLYAARHWIRKAQAMQEHEQQEPKRA